jgi:hypothetical protein
MVEEGVAELDDLLKQRIAALKTERERTRAAMEQARSEARLKFQISRLLIERFAGFFASPRSDKHRDNYPREFFCAWGSRVVRGLAERVGAIFSAITTYN